MSALDRVGTTRAARLRRFLAPRHLAFFGGGKITAAIARCRAFGFDGPIWLVNPRHAEIDGIRCYASVDELPEAPDASFIATPAAATVEIVRALAACGAGGAAAYASGFAEAGDAALQRALVEAAGDLALLGPNCYGLIDGLHGAALWPVAQGARRVSEGVAVITQSGNLGYNLSMSERGVPFAYLISVGNQAVLDVAALVEALLDEPRVKAIGVHLEGLRDVAAFSRAAARALERGIPIVALKVGASQVGAKLALSHTSSLAGSDAVYQALFARLGIVRVDTPVALLETLKCLAHGMSSPGRRLAALTCSGGDAGLAADLAEREGIDYPELSDAGRARLREVLPDYATLSNPLDFTTTAWGEPEVLGACCDAVLAEGCDAGVLVLDYPKQASGERPACDLVADTFAAALARHRRPGAVVSVFPELLPVEAVQRLAAAGVPALQGLHEGFAAIAAGMRYAERRAEVLAGGELERLPVLAAPSPAGEARLLDEWDSKQWLRRYGLPVPEGVLVAPEDAPAAAEALGFPVCVKLVSAELPHKTEMGAVELRLGSAAEVAAAVARMRAAVAAKAPQLRTERILVERMAPAPVAELIVGVKREAGFGLALVIGAGGVLVEVLRDSATLLLPTDAAAVRRALMGLRSSRLLTGYRGSPAGDVEAAVRAILAVAEFAVAHAGQLEELDVNPLLVLPNGAVAVDALIRISDAVLPGPR